MSGNPLATVAGVKTLQLADAGVYQRLDARSEKWRSELVSALDAAGVTYRLQNAGNLFSVFLGVDSPVRNYDNAKSQNAEAYTAFFHAMLDAGVNLPPSCFEAWFLSDAHDDEAFEVFRAALPKAAQAASQVISA